MAAKPPVSDRATTTSAWGSPPSLPAAVIDALRTCRIRLPADRSRPGCVLTYPGGGVAPGTVTVWDWVAVRPWASVTLNLTV